MSLPGLRGAEHLGLTVPDLEAACAFLVEVIGAVEVFDGGTIEDPDVMTRVLRAPAGTTTRYRFLRLGTGLNLEVFEYAPATGAPPGNHAAGGHHIALYVDDIDAAHAHLAAHGVALSGPPEHIADGPAAGSAWFYFRAPWGLQMECVSYPDGKAYEATAETRLWSPLKPQD
jgi:glyoxylase I family protein